jgi:hypothetical protein
MHSILRAVPQLEYVTVYTAATERECALRNQRPAPALLPSSPEKAITNRELVADFLWERPYWWTLHEMGAFLLLSPDELWATVRELVRVGKVERLVTTGVRRSTHQRYRWITTRTA